MLILVASMFVGAAGKMLVCFTFCVCSVLPIRMCQARLGNRGTIRYCTVLQHVCLRRLLRSPEHHYHDTESTEMGLAGVKSGGSERNCSFERFVTRSSWATS